jgi:hypothetical protein
LALYLGGSVGRAWLTETRLDLEPYWGKPAVRNLRGDDGNVGIIRSPVRAIVLPDRAGRVLSRERNKAPGAHAV